MSRTYVEGDTVFIGNSDLSGEFVIINEVTREQITIENGEDILNFILEWIKSEKISRIEDATNKEFLKEILKS